MAVFRLFLVNFSFRVRLFSFMSVSGVVPQLYHTYKRIGILKGEIFHAAAADVKKDLPGIEYPFKG